MKPNTLTDVELLEGVELAATRARLAGREELRKAADILAGLALEAAGRLRDVLEIAPPRPRPLTGRARNVTIHPGGRLTCELEIDDAAAGARFLEQIGGRPHAG